MSTVTKPAEHPGIDKEDRLHLNVVKLKYTPSSATVQWALGGVNTYLPKMLAKPINYFVHAEKSAPLHDVSFVAPPSQVTAVLSSDPAERRTIMELICNRRNHGDFSGDVFLTGSGVKSNVDRSIAFVPRAANKLYTAGLSYLEMITYAARLRMDISHMPTLEGEAYIYERVMQILGMMELVWCKDRLIPERPTTRGNIGGELRRLSVAVEFVNLPPVLVLEDPTRDLDAIVSAKLVECLHRFTEKGHTVVTSLVKPSAQVFAQLDRVVVLSGGRTIYASERSNITRFYCSGPMDYSLKDGMDTADFLLDIADGVERPTGARKAPSPETLQTQFEASPYFTNPAPRQDTKSIAVLPVNSVPFFGYFDIKESLRLVKKTPTVVERAFFVKFREYEVLKKSLSSSAFMGLFIGYFLWNDGNFGDYCLSLVGMPYIEVTNVGACLFLMLASLFGMQVINVHIICQKLQVFRYERSAKCCPTFGFWVAIFVSEVPFTIFFGLVFSNISYYMSNMKSGVDNYFFYMGVHALTSVLGFTTALMFAAVSRREIIVRDFFLFCLFMNSMTSGFMFQQNAMEDAIVDISVINPLRWAYEALMVWKFASYPDGDKFLSGYSFDTFHKHKVYPILINFLIFDLAVLFLALIPAPNTLRRRTEKLTEEERQSEFEDVRFSSRLTEPVKPNIFLRESSVTGKTHITSQPSATGLEGDGVAQGPTVFFSNVTFRVPDRRSPVGYKNVLNRVTGRFDWGKLSAIMGAEGAGKSSLLHILGGQHMGTATTVNGTVFYNGKPINKNIPPWQRCAFVEAVDEHLRDLSVSDVVTYAMQLRCADRTVFKQVGLNVKQTLELLQLTDVMDVRTKDLTFGQRRRLSIAEEIVHGPELVLIDEPISNLNVKDASIIMTGTLRELVNQERTVIATMHQPSAAVFELFDTLCLLSKGRLIYMGRADEAAAFFLDAPELQFDFSEYANPADFLFDVSGSLIHNRKGEYVDAPVLEHYYKESELCERYVPPDTSDLLASNFNSRGVQSFNNPLMAGLPASTGSSINSSLESGSVRKDQRVNSDGSQGTPVSSFDIGREESTVCPKGGSSKMLMCALFMESVSNAVQNVKNMDLSLESRKAGILLRRSWYTLMKRYKLVVGSTIVALFIAFNFGWILGESTDEASAVTAVFAMGALLLIISNVQFVFFLFHNNEVFLREHSRGLYSAFIHWIVDDLPLMLLRTVQAFVYAVIVHEILELNEDGAGFYYLTTWMIMLAGTTMVTTIVYTLPDVRSAYSVIPGVSLLLFFFSGLIFKPATYPEW
eukprot:CAMPEP_0185030590 /NCGR_PEP_ID=MMETSP1103-20130426/17564_1 /TAXON_ID=36769 /ORGANISM="Paraphysomonas bandaiensis, Strain Caron Lab Isolate" /LENGTH=1294 /DNA_ID=CAMNT_0027565783 /DNA_START=13 /DNA_END=3894 /DNA_ORIENTATION=-